jgi:hypothetical protein
VRLPDERYPQAAEGNGAGGYNGAGSETAGEPRAHAQL